MNGIYTHLLIRCRLSSKAPSRSHQHDAVNSLTRQSKLMGAMRMRRHSCHDAEGLAEDRKPVRDGTHIEVTRHRFTTHCFTGYARCEAVHRAYRIFADTDLKWFLAQCWARPRRRQWLHMTRSVGLPSKCAALAPWTSGLKTAYVLFHAVAR